MVLTKRKAKVDDFPAVLAELEAGVRPRGARVMLVVYVVVLAATVALGAADLPCLGLFVAVPATLIFVFKLAAAPGPDPAAEKVAFVKELYALLRDELEPRSSLVIDFDLRHYDLAEKRTWRGTSYTGKRSKETYTDKWLHLRGVLADGTVLEIVRQAGVKVKSGSVQAEKRRLFIELRPSPKRYPLERILAPEAASRLEAALAEGLKKLHNSAEGFKTRVAGTDSILVKVVQLDAPILAGEVVMLMEHALRFMAAAARSKPEAA